MKPLPDDHPIMKAINKAFSELTQEERESFHRVTCLNGRDPQDIDVIERLALTMELAIKEGDFDL